MPLEWVSILLEAVLSRRGLCLLLLMVIAVPAFSGWLRPPISADINAFQLPLLGMPGQSSAGLLHGSGGACWLSIGTMLAATLGLGGVVAVLWPKRFSLVAGLCLCAVMCSAASASLNHPELIELLDGEMRQRQQLVSVLEETVKPAIDITAAVRVRRSVLWAPRESFGRGMTYLTRNVAALSLLSAAGTLLSLRGPLRRRLGCLLLTSLGGVVLGGLVCGRRLAAERLWARAMYAERRAEIDAAVRYAESAVAVFPQLGRLDRTWMLLGKADYLRGRDSPGSEYYRAHQLLAVGKRREGIALLEDLCNGERTGAAIAHTPLVYQSGDCVKRSLANAVAARAFGLFRQGRLEAAGDQWQRALELDASQIFRPLLVAAARAGAHCRQPEPIAARVDPLLDRLADRALKASLLAMLGDVYFAAGRFVEARGRYERSVQAFALPKSINYRAMRGLLGM